VSIGEAGLLFLFGGLLLMRWFVEGACGEAWSLGGGGASGEERSGEGIEIIFVFYVFFYVWVKWAVGSLI